MHCCQNNVQTCAGSQRLRLTKIPQIMALFFSHKHFPAPPLCLPPSPRLLLDFRQRRDETLPLSFRFLSASHSPRLRQCLNVNESASPTSFILLPLTQERERGEVRDSFDHFKARSGDGAAPLLGSPQRSTALCKVNSC